MYQEVIKMKRGGRKRCAATNRMITEYAQLACRAARAKKYTAGGDVVQSKELRHILIIGESMKRGYGEMASINTELAVDRRGDGLKALDAYTSLLSECE